ncbi:putative bifunctional diguanylate cyclase/phosphodiesterase [Kineococcus sp. SYSU DK005]|uniref:putative bifunctional diguanylate cyclase/phosphodiesterase n=1 Tax=Kineococcus sp. SYSU DK005 TaxID=3383126 RepID=UPI003D7E2377
MTTDHPLAQRRAPAPAAAPVAVPSAVPAVPAVPAVFPAAIAPCPAAAPPPCPAAAPAARSAAAGPRGAGALARRVFASLSAAVVVADARGVVLDVNDAFEELVRASHQPLPGRAVQDLLLTAGGPLAVEELVRHLGTAGGGLACEVLVRRLDGTTCPGRATAALARLDGRDVVVLQVLGGDGRRPAGGHPHRADLSDRTDRADRADPVDRDPLTGLRTRAALLEELDRRLAVPGPPLALLVCDLDRFRVLNTDLGHEPADEVLVTTARRLLALARGGDLVARLGGDEFAVVVEEPGGPDRHDGHDRPDRPACPDGPPPGAALEAARRLAAALREPMRVGVHEVACAAGVGVALAERRGDRDPDARALLRDAGTALREAKSTGPGAVRLFRPAMRERVLGRRRLEDELRRALRQDELEVHYQPVVRLADGTRTGFEALVRWSHPERGLLLPELFLPVAHEAGLATAVDAFVLERALDLLQRRPGVHVAVNTCADRFDGTFADEVAAGLRRRGVAPSRLVVELLEHSLLPGDATTARELQRLAETGVGLAVDDFGTGYSALAHLQNLPVTALKLDRAFVTGLPGDVASDRIAAAVAGLARGLGLVPVAEGVETVAQAVRLRAQGWELAQGWFYGAPAPERHWYPGPRSGTIG